MNIFVLDLDPKKCAQYHCNKHVIKMILESTQLLCDTLHVAGTYKSYIVPYKATHINHPCAIWARASLSNWLWLKQLALELCKEYTIRYGKQHKCEAIIKNLPNPNLIDYGLTIRPLCMPDEVKKSTVVESYHNYYLTCKQALLSWKVTNPPYWVPKNLIK